jgi:hypothetical protein
VNASTVSRAQVPNPLEWCADDIAGRGQSPEHSSDRRAFARAVAATLVKLGPTLTLRE